jgi:hypothetical protein
LVLKGTGELSPSEPTARKFDPFSIRAFGSPLSRCSKTERNNSKLGFRHPTKRCDDELKTESEGIADEGSGSEKNFETEEWSQATRLVGLDYSLRKIQKSTCPEEGI